MIMQPKEVMKMSDKQIQYDENGFRIYDDEDFIQEDSIEYNSKTERDIHDSIVVSQMENRNYTDIINAILVIGNNPEIKLPNSYLNDPNTVLDELRYYPEILAQTSFTNDSKFMEQAIQINPECFQYASDELRNDRQFINSNIQEPKIAEFLGSTLLNDKEFLNNLVKSNPDCAIYIDNLDRDTLIYAISKNGSLINDLPEMQKDEEAFRTALSTNSKLNLKYVPETISNDEKLFESLLSNKNIYSSGNLLQFASESIKNNPQIVELALKNNGTFQDASDELKKNKDIIRDFMDKGYYISPKDIDPSLYQDKEFMKKAIQYDQTFYEYSDKKDPDIIKTLLERQNKRSNHLNCTKSESMEYELSQVPSDMWKNDEIRSMLNLRYLHNLDDNAKAIIAQDKDLLLNDARNGFFDFLHELEHIDGPIHDKDFAISLVHENPQMLQHLHEFQNDKDVVLEAVKKDPTVSIYMAPELRNDEHFALDLVNANPKLFFALSDRVQAMPEIQNATLTSLDQYIQIEQGKNHKDIPDKETLLENIAIGEYEYEFESILQKYPEYKNDPDVVMAAVDMNPEELKYSDLRGDKDFVMQLLDKDLSVERYIDSELFKDRDVAMKVMENNPMFYKSLSDLYPKDQEMIRMAVAAGHFGYVDAKNLDKDFIQELVELNPNFFSASHVYNTFGDDKDIVMKAVEGNGEMLKYASNELKDDKDVVMKAVKNNGVALQYASNRLKDDFEVAVAAINNNGHAYEHVSDRLHDHYGLAILAAKNYMNFRFVSEPLRSDPQFCNEFFDESKKLNPGQNERLMERIKDRYTLPPKTSEERESEKQMLQANNPNNNGGRNNNFDIGR